PLAVASGADALVALEKAFSENDPFALVLLDGHMPEMDGFTLAENIQQDQHFTGIRLLMLTSAGQPDDVARSRALGLHGHLSKPVKQSELFDLIVTALGSTSPEWTGPRAEEVIPTVQRRLEVLLAEDNPVNQRLATRIFEKLGHSVTVVDNGRQAIAAAQTGRFDLIAMDVQMPEIDGLEATAAIRDWEKSMGRHVPILAMTAHAMKGARERCIAAGRAPYLPKPIRVTELEDAITRLAGTAEQAGLVKPVIDRAALLSGLGGGLSLIQELAHLFLTDCPGRLTEIRAAIPREDAARLSRAAHALKGSLGSLAAWGAFAAAQRLEAMGRTQDLKKAGEALSGLELEISRLTEELGRIAEDPITEMSRVGGQEKSDANG